MCCIFANFLFYSFLSKLFYISSHDLLLMTDDKIVIAVDYDGVIAIYSPYSHRNQLVPGHDPVGNLQRLKDAGCVIVIYTCRNNLVDIRKFLKKHDVPFDFINENPYSPEGVAPVKMYADRYIDDKAVGFENLTKSVDIVLKEIEEGKLG